MMRYLTDWPRSSVVALAFIGYKTMTRWVAVTEGWQNSGDFVLAVLRDFSGVGAAIAMLAMLLTRPANIMGEITMSVYQAMVNRYVIPVIEKHKAEGRSEGIKRGRAKEREEWLAWNSRRIDAERHGRDFDESPPG